MASTTQKQFLVSGNNQFSRINVGCPTAAEALKKAKEPVGRGYMDVRICTPRGRILLSDEFDPVNNTPFGRRRMTSFSSSLAREGSPITDLVVEDHADHVLATLKTQEEAIQWARSHGPHAARVRHLNK